MCEESFPFSWLLHALYRYYVLTPANYMRLELTHDNPYAVSLTHMAGTTTCTTNRNP